MEKEKASKDELEFVRDIERSLANLEPPMSSDCCIYRVPRNLRKGMKEDAYTPHAVSIGPLHHGKKELEPMEKQKLRYLREFMFYTNSSLYAHFCFIKVMEDRIRSCYAEPIPFNSNEFVKMILTDAAFIILHMVKSNYDDLDEVVYRNSCLMSSIRRDITLLENQIPFFVLCELYDFHYGMPSSVLKLAFPLPLPLPLPLTFPKLTCDFFEGFNCGNMIISEEIPKNVKHFTDLLRLFHLPSDLTLPSLRGEEIETKLLHSASELYEAGVNIKINSPSQMLGDCKFFSHDASLKIPPLELNDLSTCLLQNLMALELCDYRGQTYICDYISLMVCLMETSKDVDLLVQKKILDNSLSDSNEVVTFVRNLRTNIVVDRRHNYYNNLFTSLNRHCEQRWVEAFRSQQKWHITLKVWLTVLKVDYFSNPWRTASTIAASLLLVFTFIQTVFAIIK